MWKQKQNTSQWKQDISVVKLDISNIHKAIIRPRKMALRKTLSVHESFQKRSNKAVSSNNLYIKVSSRRWKAKLLTFNYILFRLKIPYFLIFLYRFWRVFYNILTTQIQRFLPTHFHQAAIHRIDQICFRHLLIGHVEHCSSCWLRESWHKLLPACSFPHSNSFSEHYGCFDICYAGLNSPFQTVFL